jgi:NitT/TauT family transport system substrate-binding protein
MRALPAAPHGSSGVRFMTSISRRSALALAAGQVLAAPFVAATRALAENATPIRFTLDWKYQGIHAFVFWAKDKGYFDSEGLNVTIDQGEGSAATISRIVSGAYDAGIGDMNAAVTLAGKQPGMQPLMAYMAYNSAPFALITKASGPVQTVKDMEGRTLGFPAGGSAGALFPALAKVNGVDLAKVKVLNMAPPLQEQMMLRGDVDASAVFTVTSYINLIGQKIDPDKDIRWIFYSSLGVNPYSNGILVSRKLATDNPKAVTGLVRALNRAFIEVAANPDAGIALMLKQEPLLNGALEKQRLVYMYKTHVITPETDQFGVGDVTDARMAETIKLNVDTFNLPNTPDMAGVFSRAFLPPKNDRMIKLVT